MMLEEPTNLSPWERDKLRLDFAAWLAKRARRFHCETAQIVAVVIPDAASAAASPLAAGSPVGELRASPSPGDEANSDHGPSDAATETTHSAAPPTADNGGSNPAPMAEVVLHAASADQSRAKPVVEAVAGSAMSEGVAVATSPETAETGSRLDAGRTASATSEAMDATVGGDESGTAAHSPETAIAEVSVPMTPDTSATSSADQSSGDGEGQHGPQAPSVRPATTGKPGGEHRASSPAPSLRQRIEHLHRDHPEYTFDEAMASLDCKRGSLSGYSAILGIKWARQPVSQPRVAPQEPVRAPKPQPAREPSPAPARAPVAAMPTGSGSAVVVTPMRRDPRGQMFWLRNAAGEYLNRYCGGMTKDRREAWVGTEAQLAACRRNFTAARDLIERVVEKEQSRVGA